MKRILNSILVIFITTQVCFANHTEPKGKYTKEKTIKKEFDVNSHALLEIKNSYGNLNITSWDENRAVIEVHIKTSGNNEKKVMEALDDISVAFQANSNHVIAKTKFNESGWNWGWGNNVSKEVNYVIKLPVTNKVDLSNDYGAIYIDKLNNTAKIRCDYGKLDIGELWGDNNELRFDYTNNSRIGVLKEGYINADYSSFVIEKTKNLKLNADYTSSKIEKMDNLEYNCDYGSLVIGDALNIKGNGDYLTFKIENVFGDLEINSDYGSISIANLSAKAGNISLKGGYTGMKIGISPNYHFNFDFDLDYADVTDLSSFNYTLKEKDYTEKHYKGYYKKQGSGNNFWIKSEYGSIKLYEN